MGGKLATKAIASSGSVTPRVSGEGFVPPACGFDSSTAGLMDKLPSPGDLEKSMA